MLDGDDLREIFDATSAYGREERLQQLAMRYARLCRSIALQGFDVAIATISLFHEVQDWNGVHLPGYVEIPLDVPLSELAQRDSEGVNGSAGRAGGVAGVDFAVDFPPSPEIHLVWRPGWSPDIAFEEAVERLSSLEAR